MEKGFIEKHLVKFLVVFGVIWFVFILYHGSWDGTYNAYDDEVFLYALITTLIVYYVYNLFQKRKWDLKIRQILDTEKNRQYGGIILTLFIIAGLLFYWYEWRPANIKRQCNTTAEEYAQRIYGKGTYYLVGNYDNAYKNCLRRNGL